MKEIKVHGLLVWDDELFQRGAFASTPDIDPDEADAALVTACIHYPDRAAALQRALAEPVPFKPYVPPVWAQEGE